MRVRMNAPVDNSFDVPCRADALIEPDFHELPHAAELAAKFEGSPVLLGAGTNILPTGGLGTVIRLAPTAYTDRGQPTVKDGIVDLWADPATRLDAVVAAGVANRWYGMECLSGIPGSVGAAIAGNVGAYGQEISESVAEVVAYNLRNGSWGLVSKDRCGFGYRRSRFTGPDERDVVCIARVRLRLRTEGVPCRSHDDVARRTTAIATLGDVRAAVIRARAAKGMLETQHRSAGSFFKNPVVAESRLPDGAPYWTSEGGFKVSAAWLVERSGFPKGFRYGTAGISPQHTLALVNPGPGTASALDIALLAREIQERVRDRFGILLEPEVRLVGFGTSPLL